MIIGSTAGKYGEASHADYAASKSGAFQLHRHFNAELTDHIYYSTHVRPHAFPEKRNRAHCASRARQLRCTWVDTHTYGCRGATSSRSDISSVGNDTTPQSCRATGCRRTDPRFSKSSFVRTHHRQVCLLVYAQRVHTDPYLHDIGQVVMVEGGMEGRLLNKPEDISGPS